MGDERTNAGIATLALFRAGGTRRIADLETDKGPEAAFFAELLPQQRDELLESFRWPFATRRQVLAELAEVSRTDWAHVYAAPADLLTAHQIVLPGERDPRPEDQIPFRLEAGDPADPAAEDAEAGALVILTDQPAAELLYTGRVTNPARFSALFAGALTWRMALDAALYFTKKDDLAAVAQRQLDVALRAARVHGANQRKAGPVPIPDFLEGYAGGRARDPRFRTSLE